MLTSIKKNTIKYKTQSTLPRQPNITYVTSAPSSSSGGFIWDILNTLFSLLDTWLSWLLAFFTSTEIPPTDDLSTFTLDFDLDLDTFDSLLDVSEMRDIFEYYMQAMLNVKTYESGTTFRKIEVDERSNKNNRRNANAEGICESKKCDVPSSYGFPNKKHGSSSKVMSDEEAVLFEALKNTPYVAPGRVYELEKERDENGVISYDASFQPELVYPWSSFTGISAEKVEGSLSLFPFSPCQVTQEECDIQRSAIISVFNGLNVYYNESEIECLWEGVVCNDLFLITELIIGK